MKKKYILPFAVAGLVGTFGVATEQSNSALMSVSQSNGKVADMFLRDSTGFGGSCSGRTDYPHISGHFPGTVSATAYTECPHAEVTVTTTLARHGWWIFPEYDRVTKTAYQKVQAVAALNCKWRVGQPMIRYVVKSEHSDSRGETANTQTIQYLEC